MAVSRRIGPCFIKYGSLRSKTLGNLTFTFTLVLTFEILKPFFIFKKIQKPGSIKYIICPQSTHIMIRISRSIFEAKYKRRILLF